MRARRVRASRVAARREAVGEGGLVVKTPARGSVLVVWLCAGLVMRWWVWWEAFKRLRSRLRRAWRCGFVGIVELVLRKIGLV